MASRSPRIAHLARLAVAVALLAAAGLAAPAAAAGPFEAGARLVLRGESGDCVPLRSAPSLSASSSYCAPDGSAATATGDRIAGDGLDWEYVLADDGSRGYAPAARLERAGAGGAPPAGAAALPVPPPGGFAQGLAGTADPRGLVAAQPFAVAAVWLFRPSSQTYLTYVPGAPAFVNTLGASSLRPDSAVTVRRAGELDRAALPPPPAAPAGVAIEGAPNVFPAPPAGGFAQGVSGTNDPAALADAQPFAVRAIWVLDAPSQQWLTYIPGAPAAVSTLARGLLRPGSIVTIGAAAATTAPAPEPEAGTTIETTITYYYCEGTGGDGGGFCGHMANGEIVRAGAAACARSRLGERFRIVGDPTVYTCEDTGGAVHGHHRDIWFRYSADAAAWARRMLDAGHFEDRQLADGSWGRYGRIEILP